ISTSATSRNEKSSLGKQVQWTVMRYNTSGLRNPEEHTIKELTESKSGIIFKKLPIDDPHVRRPDISKAKKELGWEPKTSLEVG
ncbi:MAG: hypothetical protein QF568_04995, partial [Flavobacteriales bacterium]|nr:hypothetical protein [Flavobacteriales bacterium]